MPRVVITGNTRGIGLDFHYHFNIKGWEVIGFNRETGLDEVIERSQNCDLFINNAYADGKQIEFLDRLYDKVDRMIICGSVAAFYPDVKMPVYSQHKAELLEKFRKLDRQRFLMLHLSAKAYNDPQTVLKAVDLWLELPLITEIMFDPTGTPNG